MRILIAPDSFKGTITAAEAAQAIAAGWDQIRPGDDLTLLPMADGGEGTLDALAAGAARSSRHPIEVSGPDGRTVTASWLELPEDTAAVELAETSGITLLQHLDAPGSHTLGFGQAIAHAADSGAKRLLLAIGGSASTDGGSGLLLALGAELTDSSGTTIPLGNAGLAKLHSVNLAPALERLRGVELIAISDVRNPLCGPEGAAAVFGPQKGVEPAEITQFDHNLAHLASFFEPEIATSQGAGAAGGTGFALLTLGATLVSGSEALASHLRIDERLREADLLITGEGKYDDQTSFGKVAAELHTRAAAAGAATALVAGVIERSTQQWSHALSLTELAQSSAAAIAEPAVWLRAAGRELAARFGD